MRNTFSRGDAQKQPFFFDATLCIRWPTGQQKLLNEKFRLEYEMIFAEQKCQKFIEYK